MALPGLLGKDFSVFSCANVDVCWLHCCCGQIKISCTIHHINFLTNASYDGSIDKKETGRDR